MIMNRTEDQIRRKNAIKRWNATCVLVTLEHTSMKPGLILISEVNSTVRPKLKVAQSRDEPDKSIGILPQKHWPPSSNKMYQMYNSYLVSPSIRPQMDCSFLRYKTGDYV